MYQQAHSSVRVKNLLWGIVFPQDQALHISSNHDMSDRNNRLRSNEAVVTQLKSSSGVSSLATHHYYGSRGFLLDRLYKYCI